MSQNMEGLPPLSSEAAALTEGMMKAVETLNVVAETATAYRNKLISGGWPEAVADQLSGQVLSAMQHIAMFGTAPHR